MKQLIDKKLITLGTLFLLGCSSVEPTYPSDNTSLNSISSSNKQEKESLLENMIHSFVKNDSKEKREEDVKREKKSSEDIKGIFTLQELVDKSKAYLKEHPADHEHSHVHKLEGMPVIGK